MSRQRYTGRKRKPRDTIASEINTTSSTEVKLDVLTGRVDNIAAYLKLDPNILAFGVGEDPGPWIMNNGLVPLTDAGTSGLNPPTIAGDTITIQSPGLYDVSASFGIDIVSGNNSAFVELQVNGVQKGIVAGVEFSGGQAAPIIQPQAKDIGWLLAGDQITFVATETGTDDKLLYWNISGGSCAQLQFDFDAFLPAPVEFGVFLYARFLSEELANIGDAINQTKLLPGPPPPDLAEYSAKITMFMSYIARYLVKLDNPYIVAFVNEMEARGVIAAGRAAIILTP